MSAVWPETGQEPVEVVFGRPVYPFAYNAKLYRPVILFGYSLYETTGSATAQVNIYNGGDTGGQLVLPISLGKSQSAEDWFGPQGLIMDVGIFVNVASGTVNGSLFVHFTGLSRNPSGP